MVIQEWWGLNAQIRGVADRLATAGYRALVPDLFRGKSTVEAEEAHHLMSGLNFGEAASQDIRGAVQFLKTSSNKVGISGFCMGGALTLLSLCAAPEADAGVVWYGCPPLDYIDATKLKVPLLCHCSRAMNPLVESGFIHGGRAVSSRNDKRSGVFSVSDREGGDVGESMLQS
jgi:carboxymethylenebutenolidase